MADINVDVMYVAKEILDGVNKIVGQMMHEDNIWIKKSSYEKLMDIFPEEISCGELDGKHSEVMGEVDVQD